MNPLVEALNEVAWSEQMQKTSLVEQIKNEPSFDRLMMRYGVLGLVIYSTSFHLSLQIVQPLKLDFVVMMGANFLAAIFCIATILQSIGALVDFVEKNPIRIGRVSVRDVFDVAFVRGVLLLAAACAFNVAIAALSVFWLTTSEAISLMVLGGGTAALVGILEIESAMSRGLRRHLRCYLWLRGGLKNIARRAVPLMSKNGTSQ